MAETPQVNPEPRMLIDGKLVESGTGTTFANVNPATEEVLGQVADASVEDMQPGHQRRPARLRRHRLVHQPRPSAGAASSSSTPRWSPSGRRCASSSSSRSAARAC